YGNRFADGRFGMVLSGSYNNNDYGSDNTEAVWAEDDHGNAYVRENDVRKYDVQRIRRSIAGSFDFRFNQNHMITANAMYNWRDDLENRYRLRMDNITPTYDADGTTITGYTGRIGRQTKGGIDNNMNKLARLEAQKVQNYSLGGDHLFGSALDMDWTASYSTASEDRPNERYALFREGGQSFSFNGDSRFPLYSGIGIDDEAIGLNEITANHDYTEETEFGAKLNFRMPLSVIPEQKGRLRFGGRLR